MIQWLLVSVFLNYLFIAFTCNKEWPEIKQQLGPGQQQSEIQIFFVGILTKMIHPIFLFEDFTKLLSVPATSNLFASSASHISNLIIFLASKKYDRVSSQMYF